MFGQSEFRINRNFLLLLCLQTQKKSENYGKLIKIGMKMNNTHNRAQSDSETSYRFIMF